MTVNHRTTLDWSKQDIPEERTPFRKLDRRTWQGATLERRLQFISEGLFVPHTKFIRAVRAIQSRMQRCIQEDRGFIIFVRVPSGGGKTALARFMQQLYQTVHYAEHSEVPVVAFRVPGVITMKGMSSALLTALGDGKADKGTHDELMRRALPLLTAARTALTIIDNVQDIPEKRTVGGIRQIGTWIRDYADDSRRLLVLLGTAEATSVVNANIQMRRRAPGRCDIDYFDVQSPKGLGELKRFLIEMDSRLPLTEPSDLDTTEFLFPIARSTGGIQDYIFRLMSGAVRSAVKSGKEKISLLDMAKSFDELFEDSGKGLNPFRGEVDRLINRPGEPLELFVSNPGVGMPEKS